MRKRVAALFALVAVLAVVILGSVTWVQTRSQVADLVRSRHATTTTEVVGELGNAYAAAHAWTSADLFGARIIAVSSGAELTVLDQHGRTVTGAVFGPGGLFGGGSAARSGSGFGGAAAGPGFGAGNPFGPGFDPAQLFGSGASTGGALGAAQRIPWGGALTALLAAGIGLLAAGRIARPLQRLTRAAHALAAGDRSARARTGGATAELGDLGRAFDQMATTIEREDALRRAFAADVAHELRTPLAIAQGELEALVGKYVQATTTAPAVDVWSVTLCPRCSS
jgi:two-component system sensor histidine kinase BaeS